MEEIIQFWKQGAREALETAEILYKNDRYDYALFFCHLSLEKILKSRIIRQSSEHAPRSHDLLFLCGIAKVDLDKTREDNLREIGDFNIEGRYAEEKLLLYKKATKEYTIQWFETTKELFIWLSKQ